jgi:hypothetical protein
VPDLLFISSGESFTCGQNLNVSCFIFFHPCDKVQCFRANREVGEVISVDLNCCIVCVKFIIATYVNPLSFLFFLPPPQSSSIALRLLLSSSPSSRLHEIVSVCTLVVLIARQWRHLELLLTLLTLISSTSFRLAAYYLQNIHDPTHSTIQDLLIFKLIYFHFNIEGVFNLYLIFFWFVRLLALRPLLAYCASLGW